MSRVKAFSQPFTPDDILDVEMRVEKGAILDFKVNYRCQIDGKWHDVVRYDTEHGVLHVHRNYSQTGSSPVHASRPHGPTHDSTPDVARAEADLVRNWKRYRALMEVKVRGSG